MENKLKNDMYLKCQLSSHIWCNVKSSLKNNNNKVHYSKR